MSDTFVAITFVADQLLTSTIMNQMAANQAGFHSGDALGDGIILTRHLGSTANLKIPSGNLNPTKSTDANGWTVYDYGTWKRYSKRVTFNQSVAANSIAVLTVSSTNFPSGMTNIGTAELLYAKNVSGGFGAQCAISTEMSDLATATVFAWSIASTKSTTQTYTGTIDISIIQR